MQNTTQLPNNILKMDAKNFENAKSPSSENKLNSDSYDKLLTPHRLEGESYEEFKIREKTMKKLLKKYLKK